jgi:predicted nucleic acid-binding protein
VKEAVVVDSTCLIGLERIGRLDVLPALFDPIFIPPEVAREFGTPFPWLKIDAPTNLALISALKMLVDDGEAEAIALAREQGYRIVLDDRQARSVASKLGLTMIGTVGILVRAKRGGILLSLRPLLDALEAQGFYLSSQLKEEALRLAGEISES